VSGGPDLVVRSAGRAVRDPDDLCHLQDRVTLVGKGASTVGGRFGLATLTSALDETLALLGRDAPDGSCDQEFMR
jgi:hypothetical protein